MRLVDNSGGFWGDIIIRKINPDIVVKQRLEPSLQLMTILGKEMISAVKGSTKHNITVTTSKDGVKTIHAFSSGSYKYGLIKGTDAAGNALEPLSESTLRIRDEQKNVQRDGKFILRETSKHILDGLKIKILNKKSVQIGWNAKDEELVNLNATEREVENPAITYWGINAKRKTVHVAGREFRGLSDEFREQFIQIMQTYTGLQ